MAEEENLFHEFLIAELKGIKDSLGTTGEEDSDGNKSIFDTVVKSLNSISEEDNNSETCAEVAKNEGNYYFKIKKLDEAIVAYTRGINSQPSKDLLTTLLNNRALCHYQKKNYGYSYKDALNALKLAPSYQKALFRAAHCAYHLKRHKECLEFCQKAKSFSCYNTEYENLFKKSTLCIELQLKEYEKVQEALRKYKHLQHQLLTAIKLRGIRLEGAEYLGYEQTIDFDLMVGYNDATHINLTDPYLYKDLLPASCKIEGYRNVGSFVELKDGTLIWPVIIVYPENGATDIISRFDENISFYHSLKSITESNFKLHYQLQYDLKDIKLYFEDKKREVMVNVSLNYTLKEILSDERFIVISGTPTFYVISPLSPLCAEFLNSYSVEIF